MRTRMRIKMETRMRKAMRMEMRMDRKRMWRKTAWGSEPPAVDVAAVCLLHADTHSVRLNTFY